MIFSIFSKWMCKVINTYKKCLIPYNINKCSGGKCYGLLRIVFYMCIVVNAYNIMSWNKFNIDVRIYTLLFYIILYYFLQYFFLHI